MHATAKAALAASAALVALAFAACTFERWLARRRRHELAWSVSLLMFTVASVALWAGAAVGWDLVTFRVFFLFGAILNVPWLALGTIYLLCGNRVGDVTAALLGLASTWVVGVLIACPTVAAIPQTGLPQGREVFGVLPRILAAVGSGMGATIVLVGAIWSAVRLARGRERTGTAEVVLARPGRLVLGNCVIALGTVVLGLSGILQGRLGQEEAFSVTLTVGISVLFTGFLIATSASSSAPS